MTKGLIFVLLYNLGEVFQTVEKNKQLQKNNLEIWYWAIYCSQFYSKYHLSFFAIPCQKNAKVTERGEGATDQSFLFKINYGFSNNPSWLVTFSLVYR